MAARKERSSKIAGALQQWLTGQRQKVPDGSATAKAIDYSLRHWAALTRFVEDGDLPIDMLVRKPDQADRAPS